MTEPIVGNWSEYQRLVLAELERHNRLLQTIDDRIGNLKLELELIKQQRAEFIELRDQVKGNSKRLTTLENAEDVDDALKKYRTWIIGLLFVFVTALLLPVINLILHAFGKGG